MTAQPLHASPPQPINYPALALALALLVQFAAAVSFGSGAHADIRELKATTQPLRDGDLVRIQTDVAWIRQRLEQEKPR
jgi:hypothetical protein